MCLFLALHECVFCVSAPTQNTPNVLETTKGKHTKFVLCKSKFIPIGQNRKKEKKRPTKPKQGMCHNVALPLTLKSILRQKKNYGISSISPCKNILIFKKSSKRNPKPSRYYNPITKLIRKNMKPKC